MPQHLFDVLKCNIEQMEKRYPRHLNPVFNDPDAIENIVANAWTGDVLGNGRQDAIIRMSFEQGTDNLPLHVHEQSDRVLVVESGVGYGYYATVSPEIFSASDVRRVSIEAGDIITFPRNTTHTFQSTEELIKTITYHSPYVDFSDEASFEKIVDAQDGWYPSMYREP